MLPDHQDSGVDLASGSREDGHGLLVLSRKLAEALCRRSLSEVATRNANLDSGKRFLDLNNCKNRWY
jgi:hypothetical protein